MNPRYERSRIRLRGPAWPSSAPATRQIRMEVHASSPLLALCEPVSSAEMQASRLAPMIRWISFTGPAFRQERRGSGFIPPVQTRPKGPYHHPRRPMPGRTNQDPNHRLRWLGFSFFSLARKGFWTSSDHLTKWAKWYMINMLLKPVSYWLPARQPAPAFRRPHLSFTREAPMRPTRAE